MARCLYLRDILKPETGFIAQLERVHDDSVFETLTVQLVVMYKWNNYGRRGHALALLQYLLKIGFLSAFALTAFKDNERPTFRQLPQHRPTIPPFMCEVDNESYYSTYV